MLPAKVEDWSIDTIRELTKKGVSESDQHDFKASLPDARTLTKLACAFANSQGGFFIFGIHEEASRWHIQGLEVNPNFAHEFGQKLNAEPTIHYLPPHPIAVGEGSLVYVIHVPKSDAAPHVPTAKDERVFWKRTTKGCDQMSLEEIRTMFLRYEEKRDRLKHLWSELDYNALLLHNASYPQEEPILDTFETTVLDSILADTYSVIRPHQQLVAELNGLRRHFHQINSRRALFISEMGRPSLGSRQVVIQEYNRYVMRKIEQLTSSTKLVQSLLKTHFGIGGPT